MHPQSRSTQHSITTEARALIKPILRNEEFVWPTNKDFAAGFLQFCIEQGLAGPVFKALNDSGKLALMPGPIRMELIVSQIMGERLRQLVDTELARIFHEFSVLGIQALLFKGSALAHTLYSEPWMRLGCDSDLLIRVEDRECVDKLLTEMGYRRQVAVSGDFLMKQAAYSRWMDGHTMLLDVQWDFSQAQVLSGLLMFGDLYATSCTIPGISPHARGFSKVDSLILACAHWLGHLTDRKLIWLFDIHLLVESLTEAEQIDFCRSAERKRVCGICLHTLRHVAEFFGTKIPAQVTAVLKKGHSHGLESSARLIREKSRLSRIWGDLMAIRGWRKKLKLVSEHLFPSADYMSHRYGCSNKLILPILYVHRACKGILKLTLRLRLCK